MFVADVKCSQAAPKLLSSKRDKANVLKNMESS